MMTTSHERKGFDAALMSLITLQLIMLGSLYAGVAPHPPAITPLFAIAPFLACAISLAVAALVLGPDTAVGRGLACAAAIAAAISFGPQKYFDAQFHQIWPAVITGQVVIIAILYNTLRHQRPRSAA